MKVRYIGEEAEIGSRATLAFGRKWSIGEWVDVDTLGNAYWSKFGGKISKNIFFEVDGGDLQAVINAAAAIADDVDAPAPTPKPRGKKKGA